jgi:hypothetical protein
MYELHVSWKIFNGKSEVKCKMAVEYERIYEPPVPIGRLE